jgi:hypothetical protein
MKFSLQSLIPFLPIFSIEFNSSPPKIISWQAGVSKLDSMLLLPVQELFFITTLHVPRSKKKPHYCWEGVFTAPLHNDGSCSIVACIFVAEGMCLPSRCLANGHLLWFHYSGFRASCHNIFLFWKDKAFSAGVSVIVYAAKLEWASVHFLFSSNCITWKLRKVLNNNFSTWATFPIL